MSKLRFEDHREHIHSLIAATLHGADPAHALETHWPTIMSTYDSFYVVGAGKASLGMAIKLEELAGDRLKGGAVAVVPERLARLKTKPTHFQLYPAQHPVPDSRNFEAARAIADVARFATEDDTLIALISGGGSAHLMLPVSGLTPKDLILIIDAMQRAGAPVRALNTVRKHVEQLKGGGLLRLAMPARVWAFILSDVIGDRLNVVASGPTTADPTTFAECLEILDRYGVRNVSSAVTQHLEAGARGEIPETLKPGDPMLANVRNMLIGSNRVALEAARRHALREGWNLVHYQFGMEGDAQLEGLNTAMLMHSLLSRPDKPCCVLQGGEMTVTVHGQGRGGRNQETALGAAIQLDGVPNVALAAFATDGIDGPTDAAGAIVTGETVARGRALGMDPQEYHHNSDSYTYFERLGDLIKTGPTGTNVNDIIIGLAY
jgi:hydroxypyruvate reductase